ncbi:MAG: hypothetical protein VX223_14600, partial [Myxococcota bacterium]|nr:hypothetical protein [Myxococcota bacterium]
QVGYPGLVLLLMSICGVILLIQRGNTIDRGPFGAGFHLYLIIVGMTLFFGSGPDAPFGGESSPYTLLVEWIPALDGLRYSVRFMVFVAFGLSYFASHALHIFVEHLPRPAAVAMACFAISVGAYEIRTSPLPLSHLEQNDSLNIALARGNGAVLSLPIRERHRKRIMKNFGSLIHGRPTINGYTGFEPPFSSFIQDFARDFPSKGSQQVLNTLGITTVVMSAGSSQAKRASREIWLDRAQEIDGLAIFDVKGADTTRAAALKDALQSFQPPELPTERLVPKEHFKIVSKYRANTLSRMLDGDPTTRWSPRQKQRYGRRWFELRFKEPMDLCAIWVDATHFPTDIPRGYRILGRAAGDTKWQLMTEDVGYLPVGHLAVAPSKSLHRFAFPAAKLEALRFVSMGRSHYHWLSVGELHIERAP